jgi:hypothetical protein
LRRLLITMRTVSGDVSTACDDAWSRLLGAAQSAGARAWRFRNRSDARRLVEFIEWKDPADPLGDAGVAAALDKLDRIVPGTTAEWEEAPTRTEQEGDV